MATDRGRPRDQPRDDNVVPLRRDRSAISDARRYTPRGRTLKEAGDAGDTERPRLRVVADEETTAPPRPRRRADAGREADEATDARRSSGARRAAEADDAARSARVRGSRDERDEERAARPGRTADRGERAARSGRTTDRETGEARTTDRAGNRTARPPRTTDGRPTAVPRRAGDAPKSRGTRKAVEPRRDGVRPRPPAEPRRLGKLVRFFTTDSTRPARRKRLADPRRRLRVSVAMILLLFAVLGGRLIQLQITDAAAYAAEGLSDRLTRLILPAARGGILDRDGNVLVHSVEARFVYADPTLIDDPGAVAEALSPLLGVSRTDLSAKLQRTKHEDGKPNQYVILQRGLDVDTGDRIMGLNLKGIVVSRDTRREVPGSDLAANMVGFTGQNGRGQFGLELAYDKVLYGEDGKREFETSRTGQVIPSGFSRTTPARPGTDLRLTVDRDLQFETQRLLTQGAAKTGAAFACAVVMDARTGEVLSMASTPTYNAANPQGPPPPDSCTQQVVDPGSVHKAITIGAALQEGSVKAKDLVGVTPEIRKGTLQVRDTHPYTGQLTLPGILAWSSNVGSVHIAEKLGPQKLYEYQKKFGLGASSGVGLPNEAPGIVADPADWTSESEGSIPIGMGVSTTPLQMAGAYATIANDGLYVQPHLLKATVGADGKVKPAAKPAQHRVLDPVHAQELRTAMEAVTTADGGTGHSAAIPGFRVAGKTGTGAYNGNYRQYEVQSFIGMAPAEAPRYVVAVFTYTPGKEGSSICGSVFKDVMSFTLRKYGVPPSGTNPPEFQLHG
ncbi:penicillin-binding transpeptidase domain-containing protein [Longispora sp. NPDC051575]|uniref:penicillin-binding transpeptidase domain-containing protein n=1 Tax=Longispora sp. NPDC051575 TaxID=3154943 RepID=UPI00342AB96E